MANGNKKFVVMESELAIPGGVATLDKTGKLAEAQRPDYAYPLYAYNGANIAEKFAGEMDRTEPWVWIQQRLAARDISGLHIKDWFELTVNDNSGKPVTLQMQIADVNHDLGFMNEEITKFHIDFISKDLWPEAHQWNKANYNNGLEAEPNPWLCSDLYAWLNSKKMNVPNAATVNPMTVAVDYTTTGVLDKLPESLKSLIVERCDYGPQRYSKDGLLMDDNDFGPWKNIGKLWVPNETEVYGQVVFGSKNGYGVGTSQQFQIFTDGSARIKQLDMVNGRYTWWLRSTVSGTSTRATRIQHFGFATYYDASVNTAGSPVCFRISG